MYDIKVIEFVQTRIKFILNVKNKINNNKVKIYNIIQSIMYRVTDSYKNKIVNFYTYNEINNKLLKCKSIYTDFINSENFRKQIHLSQILINKLKLISANVGARKLQDIYLLYFNKTIKNLYLNNKINKLIIFVNNYFNPLNINLYNDKYKSKSKNLILYNKENISNESDFDLSNISKIDSLNILFSKINKKNQSLKEQIHGIKLYIKYKNNILIMEGYFNDDNLNMTRIGGLIGEKYNKIIKNFNIIGNNNNFSNAYLDQLSLRDFLIYNCSEIINLIQTAYNNINMYNEMILSDLIKEFLGKDIQQQRYIITLFLLSDNTDIEYLAYLLYDLINNDDNIFNSLHYTVQKKFKYIFNNILNNKKENSFVIDNICYEKRILSMKCSNNVKQKALDKYKEICSKNNDSYKSQQYLDSLLKIPFGYYKKEYIICEFDSFKENINKFINFVNIYVNDNQNINMEDLLNLHKYKNNINIFDDISNFIKHIKEINVNIENKSINNIDLENIDLSIDNYIQNNKKGVIVDLINSINNILKQENINVNYKINVTKKKLKMHLNNFFNLDISNSIKQKYKYLLNNIENINDNVNDYEIIELKINNLVNEWKLYNDNRKLYLDKVGNILEDSIYGQHDAKNEIKRIIGQWMNGNISGYTLGFEGPPGTGKTSLAKKGIARCLFDINDKSRPFKFIALGGSSNGSFFEGHNYTYVGSTYGKIVDILIETQCMNPIIYIDELDKISQTENGKEIIGILTHLTDSTQNDSFNDKYFSGIDFDLSKVLFIFSYNDYNLIDPILADRIHRIKFNYLNTKEKIVIIKNYILPELCKIVGFSENKLTFSDEVLEYIIKKYTYEGGIRKLKEKVFEIIREINLQIISKNENLFTDNYEITIDYVKKIFEKKPIIIHKKILIENKVGFVNGLYATTSGVGGLTIIEAYKIISDNKLSLTITGQQGNVMKESIQCAKTIAWNLLPNDLKNEINKSMDINKFGIHIHCPEASTPKDGPSAGGAITLCILSLLTNVKVLNDVALTGEIDLNGQIYAIGGLNLKIEGAKTAGVKTVLVPKENTHDINIIKKENSELLENINIEFIDNIWDIIKFAMEDNNIIFNKF